MLPLPLKSKISIALAVVTIAAYLQVARCEFINLDDGRYIYENQMVREGLTAEGLVWAFTTVHEANWHPLTWLSHILDCSMFGLHPAGHHWVNVLLHTANTVLLFLVLSRMTGAVWRSALVAALFAVHPLHVESVAWVAERKDVLSTLFWILAMGMYARYVETGKLTAYVGVVLCMALGLLAKPMLVTLPFVLLLLDYWPLQRLMIPSNQDKKEALVTRVSKPRKGKDRTLAKNAIASTPVGFWGGPPSPVRLLVEKIPLFLLTVISCVVTFIAQGAGGAMKDLEALRFETRLANALVAYVHYLWKMVWPVDLAIFYPHPRDALPLGQVLGAGAFLLLVTAIAIALARRYRYLPVGWFWYLGTLAPVIGLVQVGRQAMSDRYTYVPLIGIFLAGVWLASDLAERCRVPRLARALAASLILAACFLGTWLQLAHWRDSFAVWHRALAVTGPNSQAHHSLGQAHEAAKQFEEAEHHYRLALELEPTRVDSLQSLSWMLLRQGRVEEAMSLFRRLFGGNELLAQVLARDYNSRAIVLVFEGKAESAVKIFRETAKVNPDAARYHFDLATGLTELGQSTQAQAEYQEGLRLDASYPQRIAHAKARELVHQSKLDRDDIALALFLSKQACEAAGNQDPEMLATLASAYGLAERWSKAEETAQKALARAKVLNRSDLVKLLEERLRLYQGKRPG